MLRGLLLALLVLPGPALADDGLTPYQRQMRKCNGQAEARELSGPERNHYMVDCLKGATESKGRGLTPQQRRSDVCNKAARERRMEGAERRGFLSACTKPPVDKRPRDCTERAGKMDIEAEDRLRFINGCVEGTKIPV